MMQRWMFVDTVDGSTYTVPRNPDDMTSPELVQTTQTFGISPIDNRSRGFRLNSKPVEWSFKGSIASRQHYADMVTWTAKRDRIRLTDHFNRVWEIRFVQFLPTTRLTKDVWHVLYEVKALVYRRVS